MEKNRHLLDKLSMGKKIPIYTTRAATTRATTPDQTHAITDRGVSLLKTEVVYITSVDKSQYNFEF